MQYWKLSLSAGTKAIIGAKFSEFEKFQQCGMAVVWVEGKQWRRAQCLHHYKQIQRSFFSAKIENNVYHALLCSIAND